MNTTLEEKIKAQLLEQARWYGFYACGEMVQELDIIRRFDESEIIGNTLANLLGYTSFSHYISETPEARESYYKELKEGISRNNNAEFDDDYFPDYVDLTEEETKEIQALINETEQT